MPECPRFPHLNFEAASHRVVELQRAWRSKCTNRRFGRFDGHYLCQDSFRDVIGNLPPDTTLGYDGAGWSPSRDAEYVRHMPTKPTPRLKVGVWEWYGSDQEDFIVFDMLFKTPTAVRGGVYAEVGGANGVHASNTLFFDKLLGWRGVLIEPTPCAAVMARNRPRAISVHAGLCAAPGGMLDIGPLKGFCREAAARFDAVPCAPLGDLVAAALRNNTLPQRVDFLSVDVEGYEVEALKGVDFASIDVGAVLVEHLSHEKEAALVAKRAVLEPHGFRMVSARVGGNLLFVNCAPPRR